MRRLALISALCFYMSSVLYGGEETSALPLLTVIYTAETHAALLPCNCPLQPLGGVARRAALIKQYRQRGPVLLVDGGGWGAGGMYDEDADSDLERQHIRTQLMADAMAEMRYEVVVCGESEARFLKEYSRVDPLKSSTRVLYRGDSQAALYTRIPAEAVLAGAELPTIIVSRLGEDESTRMALEMNEESLILNAGRKTSRRIWWIQNKATLANFDYQAQRLTIAEIFHAPKKSARKFDIRVKQVPLSADIAGDTIVEGLLKPHLDLLKKKARQRIGLEFWTMPECPGCIQLRPDMEKLGAQLSGRVDVVLHFVLHKEDGRLAALHGAGELQEARIQALVQKYYPEQIFKWLEWREEHPAAAWEDGARHLRLLTARIRGALAAGEAEEILQADYELMQRRRITGTPTLVMANKLYEGEEKHLHLLGALCAQLDDPRPAACKDVPACFYDAQCRKRGFIGRCVDGGKSTAHCDASKPAIQVPAIVITDRENVYDDYQQIMDLTVNDLPGIEYRLVDISEPEGKRLIESLKIVRLPAFLLDPVATKEVDFAENIGRVVSDATMATGKGAEWLVIKPFATGAHRLLKRPRIKGRADLFVSRFSKKGQEALETALEHVQASGGFAPEVAIHDALYWNESADGKRELAASGGVAEIEDAARALAIRRVSPEKLKSYWIERGKRRGSSYWDKALEASGINVATVRSLAEGPSPEILADLHAEADLLKSIEAGGEITLLVENCELVPVKSRNDLRHVLQKIERREVKDEQAAKTK